MRDRRYVGGPMDGRPIELKRGKPNKHLTGKGLYVFADSYAENEAYTWDGWTYVWGPYQSKVKTPITHVGGPLGGQTRPGRGNQPEYRDQWGYPHPKAAGDRARFYPDPEQERPTDLYLYEADSRVYRWLGAE